MLHLLLYVLLAIVVAVGLFLLASRFLPTGEQIAPVTRDEPVWTLPHERRLQAEDVDTVRLPVALRGYRFAETDILLDRLAGELRERDAEIARLRGGTPTADEPENRAEPENPVEPKNPVEPENRGEPENRVEPEDREQPAEVPIADDER